MIVGGSTGTLSLGRSDVDEYERLVEFSPPALSVVPEAHRGPDAGVGRRRP